MKPTKNTYTIIHTFIDKKGHLISKPSTGINGGDDTIAQGIYDDHVASAEDNQRLLGVVLIDAAENVIAEWTKPVESERAA